MSQEQRLVDVVFLSGGKSKAVARGNNAAWHCACGHIYWLIGRSRLTHQTPGYRVDCPACGRKYFVEPEGGRQQANAVRVLEV